jgi:hypothetical protein
MSATPSTTASNRSRALLALIHELDKAAPASNDARLGHALAAIIDGFNALQADHQNLQASYAALVAKLDSDTVGSHAYSTTTATEAPTLQSAQLGQLGSF